MTRIDGSRQHEGAGAKTGPPLAVLLVEDHAGVARLIQELLRDYAAFQIAWVETLAAALARLSEAPVDLVLLDLGLPDSWGLETVTRVVGACPALPVIVLTGHGEDDGLARAALTAGAEDYLSKDTIEPGILARAMRYACERKRAEAALREAHEYTNQIIQSVQEGIVVYDRELRHQVWNPALEALSGVPAQQLLGRSVHEAPSFLREPTTRAALQQALDGAVITLAELAYPRPDGGGDGWLAATFGPLRDGRGTIIGVIGSLRDITVRKEAEEVLRSQSMVDDLTGLHNRRGFLALAAQCLRLADRNRKAALLVFADLDGLKALNDTLGHAAGDQALRGVATILRQTFRTSDVLARLGGDEFAVLVVDTPFASRDMVLARLEAGLRAHNASAVHPLSLSLGVAHYDLAQRCSVEDLLARADAAMYEQKSEKKRRLFHEDPRQG